MEKGVPSGDPGQVDELLLINDEPPSNLVGGGSSVACSVHRLIGIVCMAGERIAGARKNVKISIGSRRKHQIVNIENFTEKGAIVVARMVFTTALAAMGTTASVAIATVIPGIPPPP